jgi:phosphatidylethanolamine-binding protein (PEBP) family uncharacterized protein
MIIEYSKIKITNKNLLNLSKVSAAHVPNVDFEDQLKDGQYYTLIMFDPNAPTIVKNRVHVHWIIINIQKNTNFDIDTLLVYTGPNPPPGSGVHNYIFKLYKQSTVITKDISKDILKDITTDKRSISISHLLKQLQLTNHNLVSSISFTCTASSSNNKKSRRCYRRRSRRQKSKSRRQRF